MDSENLTRIIGGLVALALLLGLCALTGAGMFWLGRSTASQPQVEVQETIQEPEAQVEAAQATEPVLPEAPAEEAQDAVTPAAGEAESFAQEPAETVETQPTAEATATPAVTESEEAPPPTSRNADFTEEDLQIMWEAWDILQHDFDGQIPGDEELSYAVIRGLIDSLDDDFTSFAPPDVAERMRENLEGSFEGIGAFVEENEEGLTQIVRPMDGQPADLAGLKAGDVVVGVDGESVLDRSLDEVIAMIRGPRGTEVTLTVERETEPEPFDVTITRELIEIPIIESEMLDEGEGIAYVHLTSFNRNADSQLRQALDELLAQNPQGLIFDLRDNPGGYLDQSIAVADAFLPEGVVLYERSRTMDIDEEYRSDDGDLAESIPLVVLVNAGSASASEIVAGAIRDNERGVLIGETTFGKGSVQQTHTLSDGSELRVTIARWYIPSNQSIDGQGITPDIEVETPEDLGGENDTQLQRAIDYLLENGQ